jgi:hypothetical protein
MSAFAKVALDLFERAARIKTQSPLWLPMRRQRVISGEDTMMAKALPEELRARVVAAHKRCEGSFAGDPVARLIQSVIGGHLHGIQPSASIPGKATLVLRSGQATGWFYGQAVVIDGRVCDATTGPEGLPINEHKAVWEYADVIDFGF